MDIVVKKELHSVVEMEQVGHADMCDASDNANVDSRTGLALDLQKVRRAGPKT